MSKIPTNTEYKAFDPIKQDWYCPDHDAELIFHGNCGNAINWNEVIDIVKDKEGTVLPNLIWDNPHFEEMKKLYTESNYIIEASEWINYYPEQDYDISINEKFGEFVGYPKYARAWISRINPGKTAPWHWDLDDKEAEYIEKGDLIRFVCKMNIPAPGQVTIIGNNTIHGGLQGDIYEWPDHRMWHGSVNCGLKPKYQFNYLGYR